MSRRRPLYDRDPGKIIQDVFLMVFGILIAVIAAPLVGAGIFWVTR